MPRYTIPSPQFIAQAEEFEGFSPTPYLCPARKVTIGFGTNLEAHPRFIPFEDVRSAFKAGLLTGKNLLKALQKRGMRWDQSQARAAMLDEVHATLKDLQQRCPTFVELVARDEYVRAEALLDMAYNMGVGKAPYGDSKGSGLLMFYSFLPRMQKGDYTAAAKGLASTRWYSQVGRRSRIIAEQIRTGRYANV